MFSLDLTSEPRISQYYRTKHITIISIRIRSMYIYICTALQGKEVICSFLKHLRTIDLGWRLSSCDWWGFVCDSVKALSYVERRLKNADRVEITWLRQLRTPERVDVSELFLRSNYLRFGGHFLCLCQNACKGAHQKFFVLCGFQAVLRRGNSFPTLSALKPGHTWTCKKIVKQWAASNAFKWLLSSMALDCESVCTF